MWRMTGQVIYRVLFARLDCVVYSPIPVSCEIGDRPPFLGTPGPQVNMILGTPGALFSYEIGDPHMKLGTAMQWSIFPGKDFPNYDNII